MARAGITAERLTATAVEVADELSFEAVTISAVARRLGVKDPSLYAHVRGVRELKTLVTLRALAEMADSASAALAGRAGRDALIAFATAYRDYAKKYPGRYAAAQFDLDPETAAASAGPRHAELNRSILHGYNLPEPARTDAVRFLGGAIHGFVALELAGGFRHTSRSTDKSWRWSLDALDRALRSSAAG
jgi:AcrR family transcriptional regulator